MNITEYTTTNGDTCVTWIDGDTVYSMLKTAYEAQQAQVSTPLASQENN